MTTTDIKKALGLTGNWKMTGMSTHAPEFQVWVTVAKLNHPLKGTRYARTTPLENNYQIHGIDKETYVSAMLASLS